MRLPTRERKTLGDQLVWQAASLLLAYPDDLHSQRLETVAELLSHISGPAHDPLARCHRALGELDLRSAAEDYVATFDLAKRTTMYLTYWTDGDTRNRGAHMHEFTAVYRGAGAEPPTNESPDHLPVVLEFAAIVDPRAGRRLLAEHRMAIEVLLEALTERESCYADAVAAVCATLPAVTDQETRRARRLAEAGPPAEAVGLQPFTLTVPPRRAEGAG